MTNKRIPCPLCRGKKTLRNPLIKEIIRLHKQNKQLVMVLKDKPVSNISFDINDYGYLDCLDRAFEEIYGIRLHEVSKMLDDKDFMDAWNRRVENDDI